MSRILIRGLDALLVVACCYLLGVKIVGPLAGAALAPAAATQAAVAAAPTEAAARSWSERQIVLTRNLFNAKILENEGAQEEIEDSYEKTKLPLRLLGTAAGNGAASWAAVEDQETRRHLVVRQGDTLKGRAEVMRIDRRRIVLRNGGKLEELGLEELEGTGSGVVPSQARSAVQPRASVVPRAGVGLLPNVQRLAENRFAVARGDVANFAQDPSALFSQAHLQAHYKDGVIAGVQLSAIKPGSLFQRIGIQEGDIITELNGMKVTGQEGSSEVLRELSQAESLTLTVAGRDGSTRQLQYQVQ